MPYPRIFEEKSEANLNARVTKAMRRELLEICNSKNTTIAKTIRALVVEYIEKNKKEKDTFQPTQG